MNQVACFTCRTFSPCLSCQHMFDQLKMMKQARDLQKKMADITLTEEYKGIKITVNGKQEILSLEIIDVELLSDKEKLERNLKDSINNALSRSQREIATKMQGDLSSLLGL